MWTRLPEECPNDTSWLGKLMTPRDAVAGPFGLKTTPPEARVPEQSEPGRKMGIFEVYQRNKNEILMGIDDRHMLQNAVQGD
jgi:hypothetical protein